MVLLRIPAAEQPMAGIEGFEYRASDGLKSVNHTLFDRNFAAMGIQLSEPEGCIIGSHP